MDQDQKNAIIKNLEEKGAKLPCPRCGKTHFSIIDGYFNHILQKEYNSLVIGGPTIPVVVIACTNCGFLSQHALGGLGLLPSQEEKKSGGSDDQ